MYPFTYNTLGPFSARGATPPPTPPPPADPDPPAFWGFGCPSDELGICEPYGQGWDDHSPLNSDQATTPANLGYGTPGSELLTNFFIIGQYTSHTPDGLPWYADDGGDIAAVSGPWSSGAPAGLLYRVRVLNQDTGTIYPNDPTKSLQGMRGIRPGAGTDLTVRGDGYLVFGLCPLPPGVYDVVVYAGPAYADPYVIEDAFRVVYRHYSREAWSIRKKVPSHWHGMGPRAIEAEPLPDNNRKFPQLNYRSLTAAIAEEVQFTGGKAVTRLIAEVLWSPVASVLQVETTLGFPDNGSVTVGPWEFTYSGRAPTAFLNCYPARVYSELALSAGTTVVSNPADWLPTE